METIETTRPARINTHLNVNVPKYANLSVYYDHFSVSVTLQVSEFAANWLSTNLPSSVRNTQPNVLKCFVFSKLTRKGIRRYYASIIREYKNLNLIDMAIKVCAYDDLCVLKREIRLARIAELYKEIDNIR